MKKKENESKLSFEERMEGLSDQVGEWWGNFWEKVGIRLWKLSLTFLLFIVISLIGWPFWGWGVEKYILIPLSILIGVCFIFIVVAFLSHILVAAFSSIWKSWD
ncbi:MAG: hypothetical protein LBD11_08870 [Candidatus Peribacteria bacterium]|jgi:hypothetical protein|nr:hypothetical protein [Candidatus Peribacteria bacterium]